jgi:hypothetical protein
VFSLLFNPWARIILALILAVSSAGYGIHKLKQQAIAEVEAKAVADALRRTQDAVRAGDAVDVTPDGLLKSDGHKRN